MSIQLPHRNPGPCAACGHKIHLQPSALIWGKPELLCDVCERLVSLGLITDPRQPAVEVSSISDATSSDEQEA